MTVEDTVMESAMHIKTKVLPGKKIEVTSPSLTEGEQVEVIIVFPSMPHPDRRSVLDLLNAVPPPRIFATAEDADRYLEGERESWDR
jgi:hypothetical protein